MVYAKNSESDLTRSSIHAAGTGDVVIAAGITVKFTQPRSSGTVAWYWPAGSPGTVTLYGPPLRGPDWKTTEPPQPEPVNTNTAPAPYPFMAKG